MKPYAILFLLSTTLAAAGTDQCVACHTEFDSGPTAVVTLYKNDVHAAHGLSCADCHGGDPTSDDPDIAKSEAKGFKGETARADIPKMCGSCHGDPNYMRKYAPRQRVDQLELYNTSVHGQLLAKGDPNVATCVDCHSVHDIRPVKDVNAPVYPLNVAGTCSRCHTDTKKMAQYKIPTDQFKNYQTSVHWTALSKDGDLSAPTCPSCHGNHGATPPNVASTAAVCGSCHVLFQQLYEKSPHLELFSGGEGKGGCVVCHSNHGIQQPSTAMLAGDRSVCGECHDPVTPEAKDAVQMAAWLDGLDSSLKQSDQVLARAEEFGMEVSEAQVRLIDGREDLVKARLAVHEMKPSEVRKPVDAGMAVAKETLAAGQAALHEKDVRRLGLAISVILIGIAIVAIRALIRRIEGNGTPADGTKPASV